MVAFAHQHGPHESPPAAIAQALLLPHSGHRLGSTSATPGTLLHGGRSEDQPFSFLSLAIAPSTLALPVVRVPVW